MEAFDRLIFLSKTLYDVRVAQQRKEIEILKNEVERLKSIGVYSINKKWSGMPVDFFIVFNEVHVESDFRRTLERYLKSSDSDIYFLI